MYNLVLNLDEDGKENTFCLLMADEDKQKINDFTETYTNNIQMLEALKKGKRVPNSVEQIIKHLEQKKQLERCSEFFIWKGQMKNLEIYKNTNNDYWRGKEEDPEVTKFNRNKESIQYYSDKEKKMKQQIKLNQFLEYYPLLILQLGRNNSVELLKETPELIQSLSELNKDLSVSESYCNWVGTLFDFANKNMLDPNMSSSGVAYEILMVGNLTRIVQQSPMIERTFLTHLNKIEEKQVDKFLRTTNQLAVLNQYNTACNLKRGKKQ